MGSTPEERQWAAAEALSSELAYEGSQPRQVRIEHGFWMARTEVTLAQWKQFVQATGYRTELETQASSASANIKLPTWREPGYASSDDSYAVTCLTWNDAMALCRWLNQVEQAARRLPEGMQVRLPTEAEWEYACRAGSTGRFWWGNDPAEAKGRLNWRGSNDGYSYASRVDSFGPRGRNQWGLADMLGNVAEWCLDGFDPAAAHAEFYPGSNSQHVVRGGSYMDGICGLRCARRYSEFADQAQGFRLCYGMRLANFQ